MWFSVFSVRVDEQMALKKQQKESTVVQAHGEQRRGMETGTRSSDQLSGVRYGIRKICFFRDM